MTCKLVFAVLAVVIAVGAAGLVGGLRDIDVNDPGVQNALQYAVAKHNSGTNDLYLSGVTDVVSAKSQIVSGVKYVITVNLGKTNCRKDNVTEECVVHSDLEMARPYQCTFTVWTKAWENSIKLTKQQC